MATTFLHRITLPLAGFLGALGIRTIRRLIRLHRVNRETVDRLVANGERVILAFWHDQLFLMPYVYPWSGSRVSILISRHRDGEYISRPLRAMGFDTARGSTSSGGASGLRALLRKHREGYHLAMTPDGPRGPRHKVRAGVIQAARLTGARILPVGFDCTKKKPLTAGIASCCRCRSEPDTSFSGSRSGSIRAPGATRSRPADLNWSGS